MPTLTDGITIPFSFSGGGSKLPGLQALTLGPGNATSIATAGADNYLQIDPNNAGSNVAPQINYLWYFAAVFVLLVGLKYASEHEKSGIEPRLLGVGVWNLIVVTLLAILGIGATKTLINQVQSQAPFWTGMKTIVNMA